MLEGWGRGSRPRQGRDRPRPNVRATHPFRKTVPVWPYVQRGRRPVRRPSLVGRVSVLCARGRVGEAVSRG
eukprot:733383-Prymnesium_polylepis.1